MEQDSNAFGRQLLQQNGAEIQRLLSERGILQDNAGNHSEHKQEKSSDKKESFTWNLNQAEKSELNKEFKQQYEAMLRENEATTRFLGVVEIRI